MAIGLVGHRAEVVVLVVTATLAFSQSIAVDDERHQPAAPHAPALRSSTWKAAAALGPDETR